MSNFILGFLGYLPMIFLVAVALAIYFVPASNAFARGHNNGTAIFLCNLFFGWCFVGWVVALIWSSTGNVTRNKFVEWVEK
jgi:Superinfection immunity protein